MRYKWLNNFLLLSDIVSTINYSMNKDNDIEKCRSYFDGLNLTYNAYYSYKYSKNEDIFKVYESQKFYELLIDNLNNNEKSNIVNSKQFKYFIDIRPYIMDMTVLIKEKYHPENINPELKEKAQAKHRTLSYVFDKFINDKKSTDELLTKLCISLYAVRSNMDHGEKTPYGPDLNKFERDLYICSATLPLLELLIDILLDYPSKRIAYYGTSKPGGVNDTLFKDLIIIPYQAYVRGNIYHKNNYLFFREDINGIKNDVYVYEPLSKNEIIKSDRYEGKQYKRELIPIETGDNLKISNIYIENKRYKYYQ